MIFISDSLFRKPFFTSSHVQCTSCFVKNCKFMFLFKSVYVYNWCTCLEQHILTVVRRVIWNNRNFLTCKNYDSAAKKCPPTDVTYSWCHVFIRVRIHYVCTFIGNTMICCFPFCTRPQRCGRTGNTLFVVTQSLTMVFMFIQCEDAREANDFSFETYISPLILSSLKVETLHRHKLDTL